MDKERLINIIGCIALTGSALQALYITDTKSFEDKEIKF